MFLFIIAPILLMSFDSIDDGTSIELDLQKLQSLSEYQLDNTQKHLVIHYYLQNKNRHPNVKHRHRIRATFNSNKNKFKQEWCAHYSLKWPTEHQVIINDKPGTERAFQAHHIVPINFGGLNNGGIYLQYPTKITMNYILPSKNTHVFLMIS